MRKLFKSFNTKKGSSLIAVMVTMAVLSIVALCAVGIALTNYRTTQTYMSQDGYYYSAETSQTQIVSHINDAAYSFASEITWDINDAADYKSKALSVYNHIASEVQSFQAEIDNIIYNGGYTVKNEVTSYEPSSDYTSCVFIIKTTVTAPDDTTQEFKSEVTVRCPSKDGTNSDSTDFIKITISDDTFFNNGFSIITNGSAKNTDWYGLWAGFNTFYTKNNNLAPYIGNGHTTSSNLNAASKIFTTESKSPSSSLASGIMMKAATSEGVAKNPKSGSWISHTNPNSIFNGDVSKLENFFEGIDINTADIINAAKRSSEINRVNSDKITLAFGSTLMNKEEKFYAKYNGDFTIDFATTPYKQGTVSVSSLKNGTFDGTQPAYRVVCNQSGGSFGLGYKYKDSNGRVKSSVPYNYTYADHYYKNKWFFIDLYGTGTLRIENSTSTDRAYDTNTKWWFWFPITTVKNFTAQDGWGIDNYVTFGNIVMEDCYFFVNGNIDVANAYNMSNCKFFATGDILLEKVYYLEGLLSLETEAGSDIIKQSLYYCDGVFRSELISRYALAWITHNECSSIGALATYGQSEYKLWRPNDREINFTSWQSAWTDCRISNENTYQMSASVMYYWVMYPIYTNGYLATYRYPTVLKATIIAKGTTNFKPKQETINNKTTTNTTTINGVSVILNPDGTSYEGVVDCVLIEGQIFSKGKIYTTNYNGSDNYKNYNNRYAASSQIQYQPYTGGFDLGTEPSLKDVFIKIESDVNESTSITYTPITIENSGIYKS